MKRMTLFKLLPLAVAIFLVSFSPSGADEPGRNGVVKKMHQLVREIEREKSFQKKLDRAIELAWIIKRNKDLVDSETIDNLIKLFGRKDTPVREWVTMSLGEIGPRASKAIPVLRAALDKEDCEFKSKSSTPAIVATLNKLGESAKNPCY
jgi:hypothetical protein